MSQTPEQYENQIRRMKLLAKSQTTFLKSSLQGKIAAGASLVKKSIELLTELTGSNARVEELKSGLAGLKLQELDVDSAAAEVELKEEIANLRGAIEAMGLGSASSSAAPIPAPKGASAPIPPPPGAAVLSDARLKSLESENASLKKLLSEAQADNARSASLAQGVAGDAAQATHEKYNGELTALKAKLAKQEADAAAREAQMEAQISIASSGKGGLEAEFAKVSGELRRVQGLLDKAQKDAAEALARSSTEANSSVEQALAKRTAELTAQMEARVKDTETRMEAEKEEMMEAVSQEIDEIEKTKQAELAALDRTRSAEVAASKQELAAAVAERARLEGQLVKVQSASGVISGGLVMLSRKLRLLSADYKLNVEANKKELGDMRGSYKAQLGASLVGKLRSLDDSLKLVTSRYMKEMAERKKLHNTIQELKGNIRVFMRCRPPTKMETDQFGTECICVSFPGPGEVKVANEKSREKSWEFDEVFSYSSTQPQVYAEASALVTSVMDGYNVCIFAYGQTGSGKTYTMVGPPEDRGVNLRALDELLAKAHGRADEYVDTISVSILEVYNEEIHDLLVDGGSSDKLEVRQSEQGNYVPGLTTLPVQSMRNVLDLLAVADRNRSVATTNMNEHSSRSHMMLQVTIASQNLQTGTSTRGKLNLVDLAGSERLNKSGAEGKALKEAQNINKSLSALGDVIAARAQKQSHVPFRNSTLTYLLQDSLSQDSKTLMIVCASPIMNNSEETYCSLNFASRVRMVELGSVKKNVGAAAPAPGKAAPSAGGAVKKVGTSGGSRA